MKKERIWEIDALRGFMILCVIIVHTLFGLEMMLGIRIPRWFYAVFGRAGTLFVLLSGLSATLGSRSFRRGLLVFGCGLALELGSWVCVLLEILDDSMVIRFGVLHLLGFAMMVYPILKKMPAWLLAILAVVIIGLGYWFETFTIQAPWLYALGLRTASFSSGDYFPICPQLGWFILGILLGRWIYRDRKSLLPRVNADLPPLRFLRFCGRQSLWIFVFHLPVIGGILLLIGLLL